MVSVTPPASLSVSLTGIAFTVTLDRQLYPSSGRTSRP